MIGLDLEIRFGQLADFVTGIFGYDLAEDDYHFGRDFADDSEAEEVPPE